MMNMKMMGAALLAGAVLVGCERKLGDPAVTVDGKTLLKSEIASDVEKIIAAQGDKIPTNRLAYARQMFGNQIAQSFIIENVLVAKAKADGFAVTDEDRKAREAEFLKAAEKMPDAPKSIEDYFKKFPLGEDRARQEFENGILIDKMMKDYQSKREKKDYQAEAQKQIDEAAENGKKSLAKIQGFKTELDKTPAKDVAAKFAELAKANSECPSSAKGGDLGEFTPGQMVKEFDAVAFKLPVGKVSDPVQTQFGHHLILVTKKIPAVAAKGDKPAEPEKVQASHILVKSSGMTTADKDELAKKLESEDERAFAQKFVLEQVQAAKIEASEEYKHLLPAAVEKPVEK